MRPLSGETKSVEMHVRGTARFVEFFLRSRLTLIFLLSTVLLGAFALFVTPREEEPQIDATFANIFVPFPGASALEVEQLISMPAERALSGLSGIKHVYAQSKPSLAVVTVEFKVGESRNDALLRLYDAVFSRRDWLPPQVGAGPPLVKPRSIDDVPIVTVALWSASGEVPPIDLARIARTLEQDLKRVPGTREVYSVAAAAEVVRVELDVERVTAYGLSIDDLRHALVGANMVRSDGKIVAQDREHAVTAGTFLTELDDVESLVVGLARGAPVYLRDVANVVRGRDTPQSYAWFGAGPAADPVDASARMRAPLVALAVTKRPGTNAIDVARRVTERIEQVRGMLLPSNVQATITRNYGTTANEKANTLVTKLVFATLSVIVLVVLFLGWREALVVGIAVCATLATTLFLSWAVGFTLNRVSLFALIFAIGILVDDAIVVVENIHRHWRQGLAADVIPQAVQEVGGPTILATFTVIAALLPMAFVSGLMGPYMSPIPINASLGMIVSLFVAFALTPWLCMRLLKRHGVDAGRASLNGANAESTSLNGTDARPASLSDTKLLAFFTRLFTPFLFADGARWRRWGLFAGMLVSVMAAAGLAIGQVVVLKMLPFDNKSEFQVTVDLPEGTALERTAALVGELGDYLATVAEVTHYQAYAGVAAPISFNGLIRQYDLRAGSYVGDVQVNLVDKHDRARKSHEIALAVRGPLQEIAGRYGGTIKVVEMPPGPPVLAPIVAEIYAPDDASRAKLVEQVSAVFRATPDVVDVDDSREAPAPRYVLQIDRNRAAAFGVTQEDVVSVLQVAYSGLNVGFLRETQLQIPVPIRLELPLGARADLSALARLTVRGRDGKMVPLNLIVNNVPAMREATRYRKDLLPVAFVTADATGARDSPLYGMFEIAGRLDNLGNLDKESAKTLVQYFIASVPDAFSSFLKWEGEWLITYETFRDMGIAYGIGILLIYLLVVAQFGSYWVPLVILAPVPLTVIGVMPGHALLGAQFTATSMIGMIALAGIIVRNSILLVDFIDAARRQGMPLANAVIQAAAVRAKPILLTAVAAMAGAVFILDDPIFNGLAVSLLFGLLVATVLTLLVIPLLYFGILSWRQTRQVPNSEAPAAA